MKIDFRSSFRDINSLLSRKTPNNPDETKPVHFSKLLAGISPDFKQPLEVTPEITEKASVNTALVDNDNGPMASLRSFSPELKSPEIQPLLLPEVPKGGVTQPTDGVKAPTIIKAEWVERERPISDMRKAERVKAVSELIGKAGSEHGVDPALGMSVVAAESNFNPNAVSVDGFNSKGLFQLLDGTARETIERLSLNKDYHPFDPEQNVKVGVGYLRYLHDIFSSPTELANSLTTRPAANSASLEKLAVAAFNAGEGRVASAQERAAKDGKDPSQYSSIEEYLPKTTQDYVSRVMTNRADFEGHFSS